MDQKKLTFPIVVIFFVCIILDQLSKYWASQLYLVEYNNGISFGLMADTGFLTWVLMGILLSVLLYIALFSKWSRWQKLALAVFLSGAVSNLIDRFFFGGVRDWFSLPILNIRNNLADFYISLAVIVLIMLEIQTYGKNKSR